MRGGTRGRTNLDYTLDEIEDLSLQLTRIINSPDGVVLDRASGGVGDLHRRTAVRNALMAMRRKLDAVTRNARARRLDDLKRTNAEASAKRTFYRDIRTGRKKFEVITGG